MRNANPRGLTQSPQHTTSSAHLEINNEVHHLANPLKRESVTGNLQTKRSETHQRTKRRGEVIKCDDGNSQMMLGSEAGGTI